MLREWRRQAPLQVNSRSSSFPQLEAQNYDRNYDQKLCPKIETFCLYLTSRMK
jgi:hypothetical protein